MRKLSLIILFILSCISISAQYTFNNPAIFYMPAPGPEKYFADKADMNGSEDNTRIALQIRSGLMFNSLNGFNSTTSWLSSTALIPVNSKFVIEVGGTFLNSFVPGDVQSISGKSDFIMDIKGLYSVNEKLMLYGRYQRSLLKNGLYGKDGFESMTFGMDYNLAPGMSIGASLTTIKGINPYYPNRHQPYGYRLPLFY